MNVKQVGDRLVALCRENKNMEAVDELYHPEVVSVEAAVMPGQPSEHVGTDAIRKKHDDWYADVTLHDAQVSDAYPHGDDKFAVRFVMDITSKAMGNQRMTMDEIAVYTVNDGKIVREEFFYAMG